MKIIPKISLALILLLILAVNVLRFQKLDQVPAGFHVDEQASALTMHCLATEGVDARGKKMILFNRLNFGTPKPPTYIFPGILWGKVFGFSIASIRAISGAVTVLALLGFFFLGRTLFDARAGVLIVLVASISPWAWTFSRIAYEPMLSPLFLVWGFYFFFRSNKVLDLGLAGTLFSLAMYSYPPTRAQMPLMILPAIFFKWKMHGVKLNSLISFFISLIVVSIPLVQRTLDGSLMSRFDRIGIFSKEYFASIGKQGTLLDSVELFIRNFIQHFNPKFLFVSGDANLAHSTQMTGQLSWLDMVSFIFGLCLIFVFLFSWRKIKSFSKENMIILFCLVNVAIGIIPAALTWEGIPHSLRSIGSWPFVMILSGYCLWKLTKKWEYSLIGICVLAGVFSNYYLKDYFTQYKKRSYYMFESWSKDMALKAKTKEDWISFLFVHRNKDLTSRFYLMQYQGLGCTESDRVLQNFQKIFREKGYK